MNESQVITRNTIYQLTTKLTKSTHYLLGKNHSTTITDKLKHETIESNKTLNKIKNLLKTPFDLKQ